MNIKPVKRVTIVGAQSLRAALVSDIRRLGAKGYTYTVVEGEGSRGIQPSDWTGPNGKLEIITTADVAERILEHVAERYFDRYPMIAYVDEVQVLRPERYGVQ